MNEIIFTAATVVVLFLAAIPITTVAAKALLWLRRRAGREITEHGSSRGYLYVTAPVILPCLWVISAALHQSEPGGALGACLDDHVWGPVCAGAFSLAATISLLGLVAAATVPGIRRSVPEPSRDAAAQRRRIARVMAGTPSLRRWASRAVVVGRGARPACVRGLLRPHIELSLGFVERIDDDMLRATLLHELEHVACGDPLRGLLAEVAMRLNPLSFLLRREFARWRLAREVACDRHAVRLGADRASLAQALVSGARYGGPRSPAAPAMHSAERDALELRVRLVLDDSRSPCECGSRRGVAGALVVVALVAAVPHVLGSEPLDSLHRALDGAASRLLT